MNFNENKINIFLLLTLTALIVLAVVSFIMEGDRDWRKYQKEFASLESRRIKKPVPSPGIVEIFGLNNKLERCLTCHLGIEIADNPFRKNPFKPHPSLQGQSILESSHSFRRLGCTFCHGGQGRAVEKEKAHRQKVEVNLTAHGQEKEKLTWAKINQRIRQSSCIACHNPQDNQQSNNFLAGQREFLKMACFDCHRIGKWGGQVGSGPHLSEIGRQRTFSFLYNFMLEKRDCCQIADKNPSVGLGMWDYSYIYKKETERLQALVTFLTTLGQRHVVPFDLLPIKTVRSDQASSQPCSGCHLNVGKENYQPKGKKHQCLFIKDEAKQLNCRRCHSENSISKLKNSKKNAKKCAYISSQKFLCITCHRLGY